MSVRGKVLKAFLWMLLFCIAFISVQVHAKDCYMQDGTKVKVSGSMTCEELKARSKEIDRLETEIAKQQEESLSRPKRRFVGGRPKDVDFALYMEAWRQKVEQYGNKHYPVAARNKQYGTVQLTAFIKSDGTLEKVEINKSSGYEALDNHALDIVRATAPYAPFSHRLKKKADVLGLTRTFKYQKD